VTPPDYEYLCKLLRDHSGLDLSADKQYLIESRLLPLARKAGLPGISELVQKMKGGSPSTITQVVEAMTTNETFFFRDKVPFDHFRDSIMPEILKARAGCYSAWDPDADQYGKSLMHLTLEGACLSAYLHSTETNSGSHQR
jgi:chemotaxis protein methyltransferase CheR